MKRPFEHFAAWRLLQPVAFLRVDVDAEAQQRWDGEGGKNGITPARKRRAAASRPRVHP